MTVGGWLGERLPHVPPRLAARITETVGVRGDQHAARVPDACLDAAHALLTELLSRDAAGRDGALDLLTVDALVTYAFEAASETPSGLGVIARDAAARLAVIAQA